MKLDLDHTFCIIFLFFFHATDQVRMVLARAEVMGGVWLEEWVDAVLVIMFLLYGYLIYFNSLRYILLGN